MTYQNYFTLPSEIVDQIAEHGLEYLPVLVRNKVNVTMQVERHRYLKAEQYERREDRQIYANEYKDKTVKKRVGKITLSIPKAAIQEHWPVRAEYYL